MLEDRQQLPKADRRSRTNALSTTPTVFIVDDDRSVRDAMTRVARGAGYSVEGFSSARAFLNECDSDVTGCMLLDMKMPDMTGLELQSELRDRGLKFPVIFVSGHSDVSTSVRALKAGAVDFLEKPVDPHILLERIRDALEHEALRRQEAEHKREVEQRFATLTPREKQVMALVVTGKSSKSIALALNVSYRTIEGYRPRVMAKMNAHSLPELVAMSRSCGFGDESPHRDRHLVARTR